MNGLARQDEPTPDCSRRRKKSPLRRSRHPGNGLSGAKTLPYDVVVDGCLSGTAGTTRPPRGCHAEQPADAELPHHGRPPGRGRPQAQIPGQYRRRRSPERSGRRPPGRPRPEQQEVLSRYVGWGGVADAFRPVQTAWAKYAGTERTFDPRGIRCGAGPPPSTPTTPAPPSSAPFMRPWRTDGLSPATFWNRPAAWAISSGCCRRAWPEQAVRRGAGQHHRADRPAALTPKPTSPWRALRPPTGGTSMTLPSVTSLSASTR